MNSTRGRAPSAQFFRLALACATLSVACHPAQGTRPVAEQEERPLTTAQAAQLYAKGALKRLLARAKEEAKSRSPDGAVLYYGGLAARDLKEGSETPLFLQAAERLTFEAKSAPRFEQAPHCGDPKLTSKDGSLRWVHCLGRLFVASDHNPKLVRSVVTDYSWPPHYLVDPNGEWIVTWLHGLPPREGGAKLIPPKDSTSASRYVYVIPTDPGKTPEKLDVLTPLFDEEEVNVSFVEKEAAVVVERKWSRCTYRARTLPTCVDYEKTNREPLAKLRATLVSRRGTMAQVRALGKGAVLPAQGEQYFYWDLENHSPLSTPRPVRTPEYHFSSDPPHLPHWEKMGRHIVEVNLDGVAVIGPGDQVKLVGRNEEEGALDFDDFELGSERVLLTWANGDKEQRALAYDLDAQKILSTEEKPQTSPGYHYGEPEILAEVRARLKKQYPDFGEVPDTTPRSPEDLPPLSAFEAKLPLQLTSAAPSASALVFHFLDPNPALSARLHPSPKKDEEEEPSLTSRLATLLFQGTRKASLRDARLKSTVRRSHDALLLEARPDTAIENTLVDVKDLDKGRSLPEGVFDLSRDGKQGLIRSANGPIFRSLDDTLASEPQGESRAPTTEEPGPRTQCYLGSGKEMELEDDYEYDFDAGSGSSIGAYYVSDSSGRVGFEKEGKIGIFPFDGSSPVLTGTLPEIRGYYSSQHFSVEALLGDGEFLLATGSQSNTREYYEMLKTASMGTPTDILVSLAKKPVDCGILEEGGPFVLSTAGSIMVRDFGGGHYPVAAGHLLAALRLDGVCVWNWRTGTVTAAIPISPQVAAGTSSLVLDERGFLFLATSTGLFVYSLQNPLLSLRVRPLSDGTAIVEDLTSGEVEVRGTPGEQLFCQIGDTLYDGALCASLKNTPLLHKLH